MRQLYRYALSDGDVYRMRLAQITELRLAGDDAGAARIWGVIHATAVLNRRRRR